MLNRIVVVAEECDARYLKTAMLLVHNKSKNYATLFYKRNLIG